MNYIYVLITILLLSFSTSATIESSIIPLEFALEERQNEFLSIDLYHSDHGFIVKRDRKIYMVNPGSVDKIIRTCTNEQLKSFLINRGFLKVIIRDHDSILVQAHLFIPRNHQDK